MKTNSLSLAASLLAIASSHAALTVDGTTPGTWNSNGGAVISYNSNTPDPTVVSGGGDLSLGAGASYTQSSGSLNLTRTNFGIFWGQNGSGGPTTVTITGGNLTVNATGSDESRFAFGNNRAVNVAISGGTMTINTSTALSTDAGKGFYISRDGGVATVTVTGGLLTSSASRFAAGGFYTNLAGAFQDNSGSGIITFGNGVGVFELTSLATLDSASLAMDSGSYFDFLTGTKGSLSLGTDTNAASLAFFESLITAGNIRVDGTVQTNSSAFLYTTNGTQGVLTLVPEPSTTLLGGLGALFFLCRRRTS